MKQTLCALFFIIFIYFPLNAMEMEKIDKPNTPHYDRARDRFTTEPLSLIHYASRQVGRNIASHFNEIDGNTIDKLPTTLNNALAIIPELKPLVAQQALIEAAANGHIFDFSITPPDAERIKKKFSKPLGYDRVRTMLKAIQHPSCDASFSYKFSPKKQLLVLSQKDGTLELFEHTNETLKTLYTIKANEQTMHTKEGDFSSCINFLDNTTFLTAASYGKSQKIIMWSIENNSFKKIKEEKIENPINYVNGHGKLFYIWDQKGFLWFARKNNNENFLHKTVQTNIQGKITTKDKQ